MIYAPAEGTFELPPEQALVLADENSPVFLAGAFETIASCYSDHDRFVDAFRTGAGVGWHEHDARLFSGVLRLFRPGYAAHLVSEWLPALDGVTARQAAAEAGLTGRTRFEVASAQDLAGRRLRPGVPVRLPARHG